jgi:hypothetical protein
MKQTVERINNKPAMWIGLLTAIFLGALGIYGFLGAHIFNEVQAAPKTYETKDDHNRDINRIEITQRRIEDKIDKGFSELRDAINDLK